MKEFFVSVLCAGAASGVIGLFFEDDPEIGKYIRLVLSLCLAASLIPGAAKLLHDAPFPAPAFSEGDAENGGVSRLFDAYVIEEARRTMCGEVKSQIFQKTGITPTSVDIQFSVTESDGDGDGESDGEGEGEGGRTVEVTVNEVSVLLPTLNGAEGLEDFLSALVGADAKIRVALAAP